MKKVLAICLSAVMAFSLVACSSGTGGNATGQATSAGSVLMFFSNVFKSFPEL